MTLKYRYVHFGFFILVGLLFVLSLNSYLLIRYFPHTAPYDVKRLIMLAEMLILNVWIFSFTSLRQKFFQVLTSFKRSTYIYLALFLLIGLVSSAISPLSRYAFLQVAYYFELFVVVLSVVAFRECFECFDHCLLGILMLAFGVYLIGLSSYLVPVFEGKIHTEQIVKYFMSWLGFVNPRFLAQVITWSFPLMLLAVFLYRPRWLKVVAFLLAVFIVYLGFAQQSRALLAEAICLFLFSLVFIRQNPRWFTIFLLSAVLGVLLYFAVYQIVIYSSDVKFGSSHLADSALTGRQQLWSLALTLIRFHPLLGVGPMHFTFYSHPNLKLPEAHPHDIWLLIGSEWGLLALVLAIRLTLGMVWTWGRHFFQSMKSQKNTAVLWSLTAAWIAFFLHSAVSGVLTTPMSTFLFAVVLGWSIHEVKRGSFSEVVARKSVKSLSLLTILFAWLVMAFGCYPYVRNIPRQYANYQVYCKIHYAGKTCQFGPNFWLQGWIKFYQV